ncbi:NAD(P)-dependent oxidoreductase [Clostridium ljungdahlii]
MPGFCIKELSIHAAALILNLIRNVGFYDRGIRKGEWRKAAGYVPRNLEEMTVGIFGFGASGRLLYQIFKKGFGSKVIVCDPFIDKSIQNSMDVTVVSFEEMLKNSDIISIHAPLTPETRHIFDYKAFKQMKNTSMIINVSRGGLINQQDLEKALADGEIRYAGLDVFEKEPLSPNSPLISNENVALTCHSAFYGENAQKNQIKLAIELVDCVLNKKSVKRKYVANKDVLNKFEDLNIIK